MNLPKKGLWLTHNTKYFFSFLKGVTLVGLTSKERLINALNHKEGDRIPLDLGGPFSVINTILNRRLLDYLGLQSGEELNDPMYSVTYPSEELLNFFNADIRWIIPHSPGNWDFKISQKKMIDGKVYFYCVDEWGITRAKLVGGHWFDIINSPLSNASIKDIENYQWPDPRDLGRFEGISKKAERLYKESRYAVGAGISGIIFETAWYLRGFEKFLIDLKENTGFAEVLLDKILEYWIAFNEEYLSRIGRYIDILVIGDDLAHQYSLIISPETYRNIIKPRHKKLINSIKKYTTAKIAFHSCGAISELIPDLIEIGVEVLNPIQVSAAGMDTAILKRNYGKDIIFWGGGCENQRILPRGTKDEVKQEVKKRIKDLAPGGGYIFAPIHAIQSDVPAENVISMYKAAVDYGVYPIC